MNANIFLGERASFDIRSRPTEGYPDGGLYLDIEFSLMDLIFDRAWWRSREIGEDEIDEWESFFWDVLNHNQLSTVLARVEKEYASETEGKI